MAADKGSISGPPDWVSPVGPSGGQVVVVLLAGQASIGLVIARPIGEDLISHHSTPGTMVDGHDHWREHPRLVSNAGIKLL